ncbi:hypothetical protein D3C71_1492150 [compost metagenome]
MVADVVDEVFVYLHEVGFHLGPQPQARSPVAKVIERQARTAGMHGLDGLAQLGHVGDTFVLGNLQHQHARTHPKAAYGFAQRLGAQQRNPVHQGIGADVDEQTPRRLVLAPLLQGGEHTQQLKVLQDALAPGQVQQHIGGMKRGVLRPADEGLVRIDAALAQVGQGLKNAVQRAVAHQPRQRARAMAYCGRQQCQHGLQSTALDVVHGVGWVPEQVPEDTQRV